MVHECHELQVSSEMAFIVPDPQEGGLHIRQPSLSPECCQKKPISVLAEAVSVGLKLGPSDLIEKS
ncbi:MAG: hypothetical protein PHQ34_15860 [Methanothrix sp.]|nr:hypothetical protein [Methanothrix sp.]